MTEAVSLVEITRREVVESTHQGHVVVVGPDDGAVLVLGDPDRVTFVRSAAKPFQATACLEVLDEHGVPAPPGDELAVAWSSHRGEPRHLAAVARLLARSGHGPEHLTCPAVAAEANPHAHPRRIQHNCSGKHAMFALAGVTLGAPSDRWLDPAAPLQQRVMATLADALEPAHAVAEDGCGAPAVAVPLAALARAYAAIPTAERWRRVRDAGFARPWHVGGAGRLESALLAAGVVAKVGAEGVVAAGWVGADGGAWGLAVKVEDGASRAADVTAREVLVRLGVVGAEVWHPPAVLGGGRPVGELRPAPPLRSATDRAAHAAPRDPRR